MWTSQKGFLISFLFYIVNRTNEKKRFPNSILVIVVHGLIYSKGLNEKVLNSLGQ